MIVFRCDAEGCPNQGIDYYWADLAEEYAMCGGCKETLIRIEVDG